MSRGGTDALVLALDAGTTGVRALLVDETGAVAAQAYRETLPVYPAPGLVEHDLGRSVDGYPRRHRQRVDGIAPERVRGVGITTQRATAVVWDAPSGRSLGPALSWQDVRTQERCQTLMAQGLLITPLDGRQQARVDARPRRPRPRRRPDGPLRCGTLDAWLA